MYIDLFTYYPKIKILYVCNLICNIILLNIHVLLHNSYNAWLKLFVK